MPNLKEMVNRFKYENKMLAGPKKMRKSQSKALERSNERK